MQVAAHGCDNLGLSVCSFYKIARYSAFWGLHQAERSCRYIKNTRTPDLRTREPQIWCGFLDSCDADISVQGISLAPPPPGTMVGPKGPTMRPWAKVYRRFPGKRIFLSARYPCTARKSHSRKALRGLFWHRYWSRYLRFVNFWPKLPCFSKKLKNDVSLRLEGPCVGARGFLCSDAHIIVFLGHHPSQIGYTGVAQRVLGHRRVVTRRNA